jgi:hypothetical protein
MNRWALWLARRWPWIMRGKAVQIVGQYQPMYLEAANDA